MIDILKRKEHLKTYIESTKIAIDNLERLRSLYVSEGKTEHIRITDSKINDRHRNLKNAEKLLRNLQRGDQEIVVFS